MTAATVIVDQPGVYDMPEDDYHNDPVPTGSLSHSGARLLLPPSCPRRYRYEQDHGRPSKTAWDLGHAAHLAVLGTGIELVRVDATDWRTKAAKEARDAAHAAGATPVLAAQWEEVQRMADAILVHPLAGELLDNRRAFIEQSLFWPDPDWDVWRRARPDAWTPGGPVTDYKTTTSAAPDSLARSIHAYGYHMQAAWYLDAIAAVSQKSGPFLLVFQETVPPYLVTVVQPDDTAVHIGRERNRRALEIYRDCVESGMWPGYSDSIELLGLPSWAERDHLNDMDRWETV